MYKLGDYLYNNYRVSEYWCLGIYLPIDNNIYPPYAGRIKVNELNGIKHVKADTSHLQEVDVSVSTFQGGSYLVNFRKDLYFHGNSALPATITPYNGRFEVIWDNGWSCVVPLSHLRIWTMRCTDSW